MDNQYVHNPLEQLKQMGFKITWRLICIGLSGNDFYTPYIVIDDVLDYIKNNIYESNEHFEEFLTLLSNEYDIEILEKKLVEFAEKENTLNVFEFRKWRARNLSIRLTSEKSKEHFYSNIYDFWMSYKGVSSDEPTEEHILQLFVTDQKS